MVPDHIIFLGYGIPALILYLFTIVSFVSIRHILSSTFFSISILTSIVNLLTYFNVWFTHRLRLEPAFNFYYHFANWTVVLPPIHIFLSGSFYFAQNINSALLVMDRYVAIAALGSTEEWIRRWWQLAALLYALCALAYFLAAGYYDPIYIPDYVYVVSSNSFVTYPKELNKRVPLFLSLQAIFGLAIILFCAAVNIITWIRLRQLKSSKKAVSTVTLLPLRNNDQD
ncbi:hypothetical protein PMAYCL1PPCAC_32066, partial [Pristionchus mayeri]